jgi:hypothetical protein
MLIATNGNAQTHCDDWGEAGRRASGGSRPLIGSMWRPKLRFRVSRSFRALANILPLFALAAGVVWSPQRVCGQGPNRAELLLRERGARAERLVPPERTAVEKGLITIEKAWQRFNNVKGDGNGLHFSSGHFPAGAGFGYGLGYTHSGMWVDGYPEPGRANRVDFHANASYTFSVSFSRVSCAPLEQMLTPD